MYTMYCRPSVGPDGDGDRLLDAPEAAAICGLTVEQLKRRRLPFRRKIGHRTLQFSENGLRRWLARRETR
jgi:predicted DNA-binding transcriptional regulator AlpA